MRSRKFKAESAGAAYNLEVGFEATTVIVWNYTKWASDGVKVLHYWHKGMADGYSLTEICDDTGTNRSLETSNGFTPYDSNAIAANYKTVSGGITKANPGVVTVGSTTGWVVGDALRFQNLVEMVELNNTAVPVYITRVIDGTTFEISDTSSYTAETSITATVYNLSKTVEAEGFKGITLGTTVIGANSDILYITASIEDSYENLGDLAT